MRIPKHITLLLIIFLIGGGSLTAQPDDKAERLDSLLSTYHEYEMFNGAILAAEGDEIIYKNAFGKADMSWDIPNTVDTRFKIASITKTFTATLTLYLVEQGKISLDDVITDYLPGYPAETGDRITINHLLLQTDGIPDYLQIPGFMENEVRHQHEKKKLPNLFADKELEFEPGTDWNYGNSGYYLLGLIIEEATGMSYDQAMQHYVLEPLNLQDTGYAASSEVIERLARGYVKTPVGYESAPAFHSSAGFSAGMMYSTVTDMFRWSRGLYHGRIVNQSDHLRDMVTPQVEDYGYGIFIGEQRVGDSNELVFSHSGRINGYSSQFAYFSDSDYTLIIFDNTQQCTARIYFAVRDLLFDKDTPEIRQPVSFLLGEKIEESGVDAAIDYYRQLREERSDECDFSLNEFLRLGEYYMERNKPEIAVRIYELSTSIFPETSGIHVRMAEAHQKAGNTEAARKCLKNALSINPENNRANTLYEQLAEEAPDS